MFQKKHILVIIPCLLAVTCTTIYIYHGSPQRECITPTDQTHTEDQKHALQLLTEDQNDPKHTLQLFTIHQNNVLQHMQHRHSFLGKCTPNVVRPHKTHNLCTGLLPTEPNIYDCPVRCPNLAAVKNLCGVDIRMSFENDGTCDKGDDRTICASVRSNSDVYMQYATWNEYDMFKETTTFDNRDMGIMASFVSNCAPDRLAFLTALSETLTAMGEVVHHYGGCNKNAEIPQGFEKYGGKGYLTQRHKYVFAFENSESPGYTTEKLFYSLAAGAVPIYRGASDVMRFLPSVDAAILVDHSVSIPDLAAMMVAESRNEMLYAKRLKWKQNPDLAWVTEIDRNVIHCHCRTCVRILDMERLPTESLDVIPIRERGQFVFSYFNRNYTDITQLFYDISLLLSANAPDKPDGAGAVAKLYRLWDRNQCPITTIEEYVSLEPSAELEVVMENPNWRKRLSVVNNFFQ